MMQGHHAVMPGLVPGIHVFKTAIPQARRGWHRKSGLSDLRTTDEAQVGKPDL